MADISNKTLAVFLVVAMMFSLGGFLVTFDSLDGLVASGRATTDYGTTNFSINSSISVVFTTSSASFGSGLVNGSGTHNCTLNTSGPKMLNGGTNPTGGPDCLGFESSVAPLRLQNQGTQNVSVNMSFNASASTFIGGTSPAFTFILSLNESGSCVTLNNNATFVSVVANQNFTVCNETKFNWLGDARTVNIDLGLRIPQDALPGGRQVTITAFAFSP